MAKAGATTWMNASSEAMQTRLNEMRAHNTEREFAHNRLPLSAGTSRCLPGYDGLAWYGAGKITAEIM